MQSTPTWRQQHILLFFLKVLSAACAFDGEKSMEAIQPFLQVNRIQNHLFIPEYANRIFSLPISSLLNVLTMRLPTGSLRQALLTEPNCPNILQGYEVLVQLRHSPHRCI